MPTVLLRNAIHAADVDASALRPDLLAALPADEVRRRTVRVGARPVPIGELFAVEGEPDGSTMIIEGDLRRVHNLGRGMAGGTLRVRGEVGQRLGAGMAGGLIELHGSAGDLAGAELRGGRLVIRGDAGNLLGGAEPGSRRGMREGLILVGGNAGEDAGLAMRRGLIAVGGTAGSGLGRGLIAGTVFAFGAIGRGPGAGMRRGTIGLFGSEGPELLPTFAPSGRQRPPFVTIYLRMLAGCGFAVPPDAYGAGFRRYNGDRLGGGQGEILVREP